MPIGDTLDPVDLDFDPQRVIRVHRAVEQSRQGLAIKATKNRQRRVTTVPASIVEPLEAWARRAEIERGPEGLLSPTRTATSRTGDGSSGSGLAPRVRPAGR